MATRRHFTQEYKDQAVGLVLDSGRSIADVARSIGVHEMTLGKWVKKARESGRVPDPHLSEPERVELERLRKENATLKMERDFAKKYTSREFSDFCAQNGVDCSMGRRATCFDNAVAESFFATYKKELIHTRPWNNPTEVRQYTFLWIEGYDNRRRRHSTLAYLGVGQHKRKTGNELVLGRVAAGRGL